jgi:hypothetical protein
MLKFTHPPPPPSHPPTSSQVPLGLVRKTAYDGSSVVNLWGEGCLIGYSTCIKLMIVKATVLDTDWIRTQHGKNDAQKKKKSEEMARFVVRVTLF